MEQILEAGSLYTGDYVVIAAYFLAVLTTGLVAARLSRRGSVQGYFLARYHHN